MGVPSIKTIRERLQWLDKLPMPVEASALLVRQAMEYGETGRTGRALHAYLRTQPWTQHVALPGVTFRDLALVTMDHVLETHGAEYIESNQDTHTQMRGLSYLNTGDAYTPTVIFDHGTGTWKIESWGDIVERYPGRFGEGGYYENPGDSDEVFLGKALGLRMLDWHSGQGDPIYAAGSSAFASRMVPRDVAEDALSNLRASLSGTKGRDRQHLKTTIDQLRAALER